MSEAKTKKQPEVKDEAKAEVKKAEAPKIVVTEGAEKPKPLFAEGKVKATTKDRYGNIVEDR